MLLQSFDAVPFWPTTADGWLTLLGAICAAGITIGTLVWRTAKVQSRLEDKINGLGERVTEKFKEQGERIGHAELNCKAHGTALEELRRADIQMGLQLDTNTREVTRAATECEGIGKALHEHKLNAGQIEARLRERIARIEERLQIPLKKERDNG